MILKDLINGLQEGLKDFLPDDRTINGNRAVIWTSLTIFEVASAV